MHCVYLERGRAGLKMTHDQVLSVRSHLCMGSSHSLLTFALYVYR